MRGMYFIISFTTYPDTTEQTISENARVESNFYFASEYPYALDRAKTLALANPERNYYIMQAHDHVSVPEPTLKIEHFEP